MASPAGPYHVDGRWLDSGSGGGWIEAAYRATEEIIGRVPRCGAGKVGRAFGPRAVLSPGDPMSAVALVECFVAARLPPQAVNLLTGDGRIARAASATSTGREGRKGLENYRSTSAMASGTGNVTFQPESTEAWEAE